MGLLYGLRAWVKKQLTCAKRLESCVDDTILLREDLLSKEGQVDRQAHIITEMEQEIAKLKDTDPFVEQRNHWNNKYPKRDIDYNGRYMPELKEGSQRRKIAIDVRLFVTPNDFIITNDVLQNNLRVKEPTACNETIMAIYRHTRTKPLNPYRYAYDEPNLGVSEFWLFPHELRVAKKGDCDDWGNELASYLVAAGVPPFRVRCVAGTTFGGGGHLTVYVLGDDLRTWYHINSTTPMSMIGNKKLTDMPELGDETDTIGIKDVWFSFNHTYSWSTFKTETAEESWDKEREGFFKHVKIK